MQGQGVCYISARLVRTIGLQLLLLIRYEQTETYFAVKEVISINDSIAIISLFHFNLENHYRWPYSKNWNYYSEKCHYPKDMIFTSCKSSVKYFVVLRWCLQSVITVLRRVLQPIFTILTFEEWCGTNKRHHYKHVSSKSQKWRIFPAHGKGSFSTIFPQRSNAHCTVVKVIQKCQKVHSW